MEAEELNEVATLLHITSEIATNHPKLGGIARACQKRLDEINLDLLTQESKEREAKKQDEAKKAAADYKAPTPDSPDYIPSESGKAASGGEVERRV